MSEEEKITSENESEDTPSVSEKATSAITSGLASGDASNIKGNLINAAASEVPGGEKAAKAVDSAQKTYALLEKAKTVWPAIQNTASGIVAIFADPITWIVLAVVLVIGLITLYIWNLTTFIGKNDNADGCYGIGGSTTVSYSQTTIDTSNSIASWLTSNNFTLTNGAMNKNQSSAFIGNWWQESGLNPSASQQNRFTENSTNQDLINFGPRTGYGVGLAQWDGSRRLDLANFAESKGKNWNDLQLQLDFFKNEIEKSSYYSNMVSDGFEDAATTLDELVDIINNRYEVSADRNYSGDTAKTSIRNKRVNYANEALSNYSGNYSSDAGGSCLLYSIDTSDAVQLAISMSYPVDSHGDDVSPGDLAGKLNVLPAYKDAKAQAEAIKKDGSGMYASCDKFVATIVILTMDPEIPWGHTGTQFQYLNTSSKWQRYDDFSQRQPGDIMITVNRGHIVFYLGEVNGVDMIAHASFQDRVGGLGEASWIGSDFTDTLGRKYAGFRYVGG